MSIAIALALVVVAVVLLAIDRLPIEVASLAIVVLVVLSGILTPEEALAGFASETAIFIFALLALTQGLDATGVMQLVGRKLLVFARFGPRAFVVMMLAAVCLMSSIASNTAVTAAFLPVATAWAAQLGVPVGRLLMPIAFSAMLGGTIFLFGTSTNLVVSAAMQGFGMKGIGFAELTPVGLPLALVGVLATHWLVGRLLPTRPVEREASRDFQREYVAEVVLTPRSRLSGQPLRAVTEDLGVDVRAVIRSGTTHPPSPDLVLTEDDHLITAGSLSDILRIRTLRHLGLRAEVWRAHDAERAETLVEAVISPTSSFAGRSLDELRLTERYGLKVAAIHRHPTLQGLSRRLHLVHSLTGGASMAKLPLAAGDVLLLGGPSGRLHELARDEDLAVLGSVEHQHPRHGRAVVALAIFAGTVLVAGTQLTSPAIAGLIGMLTMIATGCVDRRTAFRVDWRIVIMIGALLALGLAVEKSGAAEFLAQRIIPLAGAVGPRGILCLLMLATILLSVPMSNQAAALVMLPVAVHVGVDLGLQPRTFALGTCLAASCSFLTPLEPSAALVFGPGRYRFADFLRVGTPLTLLLLALLTVAVPLVWPFTPQSP